MKCILVLLCIIANNVFSQEKVLPIPIQIMDFERYGSEQLSIDVWTYYFVDTNNTQYLCHVSPLVRSRSHNDENVNNKTIHILGRIAHSSYENGVFTVFYYQSIESEYRLVETYISNKEAFRDYDVIYDRSILKK